MDDVFKKPNFGPKPQNYVAGVSRGAVPFFTRSDIGPASQTLMQHLHRPTQGTRGHQHDKGDYSDTLFDKWTGFKNDLFFPQQKTKQDLEADQTYQAIQNYMFSRRKPVGSFKKPSNLTPATILSQHRSQLLTVTDCKFQTEMWASIPQCKPHIKKKKKRAHYVPITDRVIKSAFEQREYSSGVISTFQGAKASVLQGELDKAGGVSVFSVDPTGYLTQLDSIKKNVVEFQDLEKARLLVDSMVKTNPTQASGWLMASRIEEKQGNIKKASEILKEGLKVCGESEDLWVQAIRLQPYQIGKKMISEACLVLPYSVKLWMIFAQQFSEDKVLVLRRGVEQNPTSVKLWKAIIESSEGEDKINYLKKAVTVVPHSRELWLSLAELLPYKGARNVLNKAKRYLAKQPLIWIEAAKLEEKNGNFGNVENIVQRGLKSIGGLDQNVWLKEAVKSWKSGQKITGKVILNKIGEFV